MRNKLEYKCCTAFGHAQQSGTDNEGYGRLILMSIDDSGSPYVAIGCDLPTIYFCPWCGTKIPEKINTEK